MELKGFKTKINTFFSKYKYVALLLIIGIILMNIPIHKTSSPSSEETIPPTPEDIIVLQDDLSNILSQISGVGKVKVMLTQKTGEETIYQTNDDITANAENQSSRLDTVTVTDSNRGQTGLVKQVNPPQYLGAVVVCEGADDPLVKLSVLDAVSKATGLKSSSISVLKMK